MKEIPLTKGYVALVDDEDYEFLMQWKWCAKVDRFYRTYAARSSSRLDGKRKLLLMHRIVMSAPDKKVVDHRNGNGLDNQKHNLRVCTHAENARNQGKQRNNTTGYCGVKRHRNGFQARLRVDGNLLCFGTYPTPEEAARAYDQAAMQYHGEFACLNFPSI